MTSTTDIVPTSERNTFNMTYSVRVDIAAKPETVWALLADAAGFATWNSTITNIEGEIAVGQRLAITVPAAPGRTFKPRVVELEAGKRMVWSDGMAPMFKGVRTFTLDEVDGGTRFTMTERLGGMMLPMIKGALPDFAPIFATYAGDLKRAAERRAE